MLGVERFLHISPSCKRVSSFRCQNVVLLCLGVVFQFSSKEFLGFHISEV